MKKILVVNGPNLNMLGIREPNVYGKRTYKELVSYVKSAAKELGVKVKCVQSNSEGKLVDFIQNAFGRYDGLIVNAGAYTHYSIALLDALKAVGLPTVEVHLSDIEAREPFRRTSYISLYAEKTIVGKGFDGYKEALDYLCETKTV